jgi:hypothetical protein
VAKCPPRMTVMHSENACGMGFTSIVLSCGKSWQTLRSREDCVLQGSLLLMQSLFINQKTAFFLPFGLFVHCLLFCHWTASWGCTSVFLPLLLTNCESIKMVLLQWHGWFSAGKVQLVNCLKSNQDSHIVTTDCGSRPCNGGVFCLHFFCLAKAG